MSLLWLFLLPLFSLQLVAANYSQSQPRCYVDDAAALLEFKDSFVIEDPYCAHPNLWKLEMNARDCCTWHGVKCDDRNGRVIGLDLSGSCLSGSIDSKSSLFRLVHLQKLNLASNDFNGSQIPSAIGNLSRLTSLDLSHCNFRGQIPSQILGLINLSSLDLSGNDGMEKINLDGLARNLTKLEELDLSRLEIGSQLPNGIANLTSLKSLSIRESNLQGEFPTAIFRLPKLQVLDLTDNRELSVHLPEFDWRSSSPLESLSLSGTNISGEMPNSFGSIGSLVELHMLDCNLRGPIPSFLSNLTQLSTLDLSWNKFQGPIPSWFFANRTQLTSLYLNNNQLGGQLIPSQFLNLTHLGILDLSFNMLWGTVQLDVFWRLKNLALLFLSYNNLSVIAKSNVTADQSEGRLLQLQLLGLASCKLREFPELISQNLEEMIVLDLSGNAIKGPIPMWLLNSSMEYLMYLNLSHNLLTGFEQERVIFKWPGLEILDLSFNNLQGTLPIPPAKISHYDVSHNRFSGEISPLICNCTSIIMLDLSNNRIAGAIPQCIGNLTEQLDVLSLHSNNLFGRIPQLQLYGKKCNLSVIDLSNNQLEGQLPRSLSSCSQLGFLNLGNNMLNDTFPTWLGSLGELRVLLLESNRFHGVIEGPEMGFGFPRLHIIDLSHNYFMLPVLEFQE